MNLNLSVATFLFAGSILAQTAMGNTSGNASIAKFSLQLPVLKYTTSSIKAEGQPKKTVNDLATQALDDGFIGVAVGDLGLYIYPFDDGNHYVSVGYMVTPSLELGVDVGVNQSSSQDSSLFGVWGYYYSSWGELGLENGGSVSMRKQTDKIEGAPDVKSDELAIKLSSTVTYPIAKNLRYFGGAFIRSKDGDIRGVDTSTFQFGLILAGLRLKWL